MLPLILLMALALSQPQYVAPGKAYITPERVVKAMERMGPGHAYRMVGARLDVDQGTGWRRLRY